jgi:hypothetical protein
MSRSFPVGPVSGQERDVLERDREIFREKIALAARSNLEEKPLGECVAAIGRSFLGTPYEAHTLEEAGEEHLVVNLRSLDCTTFMENSLVLARCVKQCRVTFDDFREELQLVRYRDGKIEGYPSRLHYFVDWVADNERKGILHDITRSLGGVATPKKINFMSTHRESYPQLGHAEYLEAVRGVEEAITSRGFFVLPAARVRAAMQKVQSGDIIGTATTVEGLDVSHTGIAVRQGTIVKFLHAPLSGGAVTLSEADLAEYVAGHKGMSGLVIARPADPAE